MLGDLGKLIVAKDFKKLPRVQKIARSGHTDGNTLLRLHSSVDVLDKDGDQSSD